ncbi:MAG: hypothetical protein IJM73_01545 [Spirochaetales bacterium]|nr:hypothetical protein [Spirochaetales bacterium]
MIKKLSFVLLLLSLALLVSCGTFYFISGIDEDAEPANPYFTVETSVSLYSDSPVKGDKALTVNFNYGDFETRRAFEQRIREQLSKAGLTVYISSDYEGDVSEALSKSGYSLEISVNSGIVFESGGLSDMALKCTLYALGGADAQQILYMYVSGHALENRFYTLEGTRAIASRELSDALCASMLRYVEKPSR